MLTFDERTASTLARITLDHVGRPYPYKLDQVLTRREDVKAPVDLHPIFHGSFDWHSCVHSWWQLLRIVRLFPQIEPASAIRARADALFVPENVAREAAHFQHSATFERPYGWAWALALHAEAGRHQAGWSAALVPLANVIAGRFREHLPNLSYPIRAGTHANTAFALSLALDWADRHHRELADRIRRRAQDYFAADRSCQAWEPGGDDFLSPALMQAALMIRVLGAERARAWIAGFLPDLRAGRPETLFQPVQVSDRSDGKIAHLDGLNLSRAWCWNEIAGILESGDPLIDIARRTAQAHVAASLPHLDDHYMGSHWLGTFALLALADDARF